MKAATPSMFELLGQAAESHPDRIALAMASGRDGCGRTAFSHVSFGQLWRRANQYAHGLSRLGVSARDRVVILVPPADDGIALAYAVMALGATCVSIDPGMKPRTMAACIAEAEPTIMCGIDRAHLLRLRFPRAFQSVRLFVSEGPRPFPRTVPLSQVRLDSRLAFPMKALDDRGIFAIVFTSGSTGRPKGVEVSRRNFRALGRAVEQIMPEVESFADLVTFPLFILISCAGGRTSVLPDMDIARPGACDPGKIVEAMQTYRVAGGFASPALWARVADHCRARGIKLPFVEAVVSAGAPVSCRLVAELAGLLPNGRVYTPYGATEALPVTSIDSTELLADVRDLTASGGGNCVGKPVPGVQVKIIRTVDRALENWQSAEELQAGQVGEICAAGENVTALYLSRPDETAASKIPDPTVPGGLWHRMGDLGYLDQRGRLWYCGRKKHRFMLCDKECRPVQIEGIFMALEQIARCAPVRIEREGSPRLALVVEPASEHRSPRRLEALRAAAVMRAEAHDIELSAEDVFIHTDPFPVDRRHNAKVHLEALEAWAQRKVDGPFGLRRASTVSAIGWG